MTWLETASARLTIFEGPDGGGKSTAAQEYARATHAAYIHHGPYADRDVIAPLYAESMLAAVRGERGVVLDRCWLSEPFYGEAFRQGEDRVGRPAARMLERLALRCGAVVVRCQPPWEVVRANFLRRKELEYLDDESQLAHVYERYATLRTALPEVLFDYTRGPLADSMDAIARARTRRHPVDLRSAGSLSGDWLLVGEGFGANRTGVDYQWPFASFSGLGCSRWLTEELETAGLDEDQLLWVNADSDIGAVFELGRPANVIALGVVAGEACRAAGLAYHLFPHPMAWKRFHVRAPYPLTDFLRRFTRG